MMSMCDNQRKIVCMRACVCVCVCVFVCLCVWVGGFVSAFNGGPK